MKKLIVLTAILGILVGCAAWNEARNSWLGVKSTDFIENGALFGEVVVSESVKAKWEAAGQVKSEDGKFKKSFKGSKIFEAIPPGKYRVYIAYVETISLSERMNVNYMSQIYDVKAGEAFYFGSISIIMDRPGYVRSDNMFIPAKKAAMFFSNVQDKSAIGFNELKDSRPAADFSLKVNLMQLNDDPNPEQTKREVNRRISPWLDSLSSQ